MDDNDGRRYQQATSPAVKNSDDGEQRGGSQASNTVALTLAPPEQWWCRRGHCAANASAPKSNLPGKAGATGATGDGGEGHGTATSGDERRAVAVTMAADQVEAEENLMVAKRVWSVVL